MLDKITNMNSIFIIMPMLLVLGLTFAAVTINHVSAIATISGNNNTNNMTKYIDPDGRFSINYPVNWTGIHAMNRFQDLLVSDHPPYTTLTIEVLPTNITDPAVFANAYKTNHSSIASSFSIPQNVECVKYQVEGQKACSLMINITRPKGGTNLEGEQVFSHVNNKMFLFTMLSKQGDFGNHLPLFQNMLTSFRSPPDTSQSLPQQQPPFNPAVCPPGTVQTSANQCIQITPGMLLPQPYQQPYYNTMICPPGTVQTGPAECTPKSNLVLPGPLLQPYRQPPLNMPSPIYPYQQLPSPNYSPPRILSRSMHTDSIGTTHIVGEVMNQSPITARFVKVIATFYNVYNQVIGTEFAYTQPSDLAPGQRAPFDILIFSGSIPISDIRNYTLSVDTS